MKKLEISIVAKMIHLFISQGTKNVLIMSRIANKLSLEKSNVYYGRVEIDELEDENFESKIVIIF